MKIIADENIEFAEEAFSHFGKVQLVHGREISNKILMDCDALIVRSITRVNEKLLKNTPVKFVGTATIGLDHIDEEYLETNNIKIASAPGCNSFAVAEYVFTVISKIIYERDYHFGDKSLGVIGYGNIGKKITRFAEAAGMKVFVNDPPLERRGFDYEFSKLEDILNCDFITLHVPMTKSGIDKTYHLLDTEKINSLYPGTVLINSSRGAVVDNEALLQRMQTQGDITAILDVWENEPNINTKLLKKVYLGTPHIAGYSLEGKVNGTIMIYNELCRFLNKIPAWQPKYPAVNESKITLEMEQSTEKLLNHICNHIYPIDNDSTSLKELSNENTESLGKKFDLLRKNYLLRREFSNYSISENFLTRYQKELMKQLRISINN